MNTVPDNFLCGKELEFFSKITASISHELNNVLSIINEYSGLLDDLVLASEKSKPLDENKIQKIAQNISEQVKRQRDIIKLLNKFAHRVDTPVVKFNLNELINDITRLSQRFVSLKKVSLKISLPDEEIFITSNPFSVQHIIFSCFTLALEDSNPNETISIELQKEKAQVIINITSSPINENDLSIEKMNFITLLLKNVNSEMVTTKINDNMQLFKICIPFSTSDKVIEHQED